jgi:hypothetical protein
VDAFKSALELNQANAPRRNNMVVPLRNTGRWVQRDIDHPCQRPKCVSEWDSNSGPSTSKHWAVVTNNL